MLDPNRSVLPEARPISLEADELTLEFPAEAEFRRRLAEDPKNATEYADEVTLGRALAGRSEI